MYLLTIETDDNVYQHIVAKVTWPLLSTNQNGDPNRSLFLDYFCQVAPLWTQLSVLSASLRMDVAPDRPPATWHGFTIDAREGETIRQAVAALMRLDGVQNCIVTVPGSLEDYEEHFGSGGIDWFTLDPTPMATSGGGEFFNPTRILDNVTTFLTSAVAMGYQASYQATFRPSRPHAELIRRARKSASALERERGVPRRLVSAQASSVQRLEEARILAEEAVTIAPAGGAWMRAWLNGQADIGTHPGREPMPLDEDNSHAFDNHIHPGLLLPSLDQADAALIAQYWRASEAARLSRCESLWRPSEAQGDAPVSPLPMFFGGPAGRPSGGAAAATGAGATDDFFFVSYAHKDIGAIRPILGRLTSDGVRIWIDSQIQVGEEWDTRLETMITRSAGVLAFLSPHYVASKHCRRELKFADSLDKAIFASAIDDFPRQEGLGYIFASLQFASGPHDKIAEVLAARLRDHGNGMEGRH